MKKPVISILFLLLFAVLWGQTKDNSAKESVSGWKVGGTVMLHLSQAAFSDWYTGGANSISATGLLDLHADYQKSTFSWENGLDMRYGVTGKKSPKQKSDDWFNFSSKVTTHAFSNWHYAGLLNFRTQFASGFHYVDSYSIPISDFLSPAYFVTAIGLEYRPQKMFSLFLSPCANRIVIVKEQFLADVGAYGVKPAIWTWGDDSRSLIENGHRTKEEFGAYLQATFQKELCPKLNLSSKLDAYSNYLYGKANVSFNWQVDVSWQITKLIGASFGAQMLYDMDKAEYSDMNLTNFFSQTSKVQLKEVLGIGLTYKF